MDGAILQSWMELLGTSLYFLESWDGTKKTTALRPGAKGHIRERYDEGSLEMTHKPEARSTYESRS